MVCSFDVDLPIGKQILREITIHTERFPECDDEYWDNPNSEHALQQPADKPSLIACFNSHLRLCEILAFALRTLYSTKKSKLLLGLVGEKWEAKILNELDNALDSWLASIPEHCRSFCLPSLITSDFNLVRWNTMQQNNIFFRQSVFLYTMYYVRVRFFALFEYNTNFCRRMFEYSHIDRSSRNLRRRPSIPSQYAPMLLGAQSEF